MNDETLKEFDAQTKIVKGHKVWTGPRYGENGYGMFKDGERRMLAHRIAFEHKHGALDPKRVVLQSCKDKACVDARHLSQPPPKKGR